MVEARHNNRHRFRFGRHWTRTEVRLVVVVAAVAVAPRKVLTVADGWGEFGVCWIGHVHSPNPGICVRKVRRLSLKRVEAETPRPRPDLQSPIPAAPPAGVFFCYSAASVAACSLPLAPSRPRILRPHSPRARPACLRAPGRSYCGDERARGLCRTRIKRSPGLTATDGGLDRGRLGPVLHAGVDRVPRSRFPEPATLSQLDPLHPPATHCKCLMRCGALRDG